MMTQLSSHLNLVPPRRSISKTVLYALMGIEFSFLYLEPTRDS